ncbi:dihydrolipoyl dehydrogenase [Geodermatophilus marinus]|uniref:dihydrolipoyl dehydrogenase n=1 Tax=Geodermatophilus sp. LHW52908 TaxID=2303986 RepID=UPI000E3C5D2D|nr:dihydrolipoyl dehydrogenase [Geodermatophilus sp. LHW52908]
MRIPDLGAFSEVSVVEVHVAPGDEVTADEAVLTLESDKATMDVPAPAAGTVEEVLVSVGDSVSPGDLVLRLSGGRVGPQPAGLPQEAAEAMAPAADQAGYGSPAGVYASPQQGPTQRGAAAHGRPPAPRPAADRDSDLHAEVLVLGAGPGGYTAAFRAADLGKRVVVVDAREALGGVCLNIGCIPSKALLHAARVIAEAAEMSGSGVRFGSPSIDLDALRGWKDGVVRRLTGGLGGLARQRKVTMVRGTGRFVSPSQLQVAGTDGSTTLVGFDTAIIACGSEPVTLPFVPHDDPRVIDSEGALELSDVPQRLLVLGGGIIGLEMATVYSALGSRITVVELMDQLIPGADADLVAPLTERIRKHYEDVHLSTEVTRVEAGSDGLRVFFEGAGAPAEDVFDKVLVAVGRKPNGKLIGADAAGVIVDDRGFIPVDKQLRTNVAHIFAIGDVVGQPMLAHKATHEGKVAAEAATGRPSYFDARVIPSVAYTDPEVAWVGATENDAKAAGLEYGTGVFPWAASGRALSLGRDEGMTKLLFESGSHRLIGAGVVGPTAGELIAEAALAIEMGADAGDVGMTVHPHPTLSESVGMAAEAFEGTITDLYLPRTKH